MKSLAVTGTLIIGCLAGVTYLIFNSGSRGLLVDQSALIEADARMAEQRLLMIEEVLFLDAGRKRNFAGLTDMQRDLRADFGRVTAYGAADDAAVIQQMQTSFDEEQANIEAFKRGLANTRNSQASVRRLLVSFINSAYVSNNLDVYRDIYRLEELLYSSAPGGSNADASELIAKIRAFADQAENAELAAAVSDFERHLEVWEGAKLEQEKAIEALVASDFSMQVEAFKKRLTERFERAYRQEVRQTNIAVVFCVLFLIGIVFLIRRLRRELEHRRDENKRLEEAVRQRTHDLEKSMHEARHLASAKSTFLANMSHEIRTPMNGIVGMAELMTDTALDEDQTLYVDTIKGSADALLLVINDILDFSKVESGKMSLIDQPFDFSDVIDNVVNLISVTAKSKNIEIIVDYAPTAPTHFVGDSGRLRQVLMNIIGNAVKFTLEGHVEVNLRCERVGDKGDITVCIRDTGIGMSEEVLEKIFDSFVQADNSSSRQFEGTGLGLAISQRLIELMKGEITVSSIEGEGSEFKISLSLPIAEENQKAQSDVFDISDIPKLRLLVVDDIELNRRILIDRFSRMGHAVTLAENASKALLCIEDAATSKTPFDLALLDYHMPGIDGLELAQTIRTQGDSKTLPIIMISSVNGIKYLDQYQKIENIDCVEKPIKTEQLCRAITKALNLEKSKLAQNCARDRLTAAFDKFGEGVELLVAEDSKVNQLVIRKMLEPYGFEFRFVEDGLKATEAYETSLYPIILMDWSMPVMSGIEATAKIREYEKRQGIRPAVIIGLSANAMKEHEEEGLSSGMDAYLSKPINRETLISILYDYCPERPEADGVSVRAAG